MTTSILKLLLLIFSILSPVVLSKYRLPFQPNALVLPVTKDTATALHVTNIHKGTPLVATPLLVDLNNKFLWFNCEKNYTSATYQFPLCHSTQCARVGNHYCHKCSAPARPGCHNDTCGVMNTNPLTHWNVLGELGQDSVSIQVGRGQNSGLYVDVPQFIFSCAPSRLLGEALPTDVVGVAGLGHNSVSIPHQLASHFGFRPKFGLCLTSSNTRNGVIFFGKGPYELDPGMSTVSRPIVGYTPITIGHRGGYHIQVTAISINNKPLPFDMSSFFRNKRGSFVKALISTTTPYTSLHHSIFMATTKFFADQLSWAPQIQPPISPFGVCFNSSYISGSWMGPAAPSINLVLRNGNVSWTISGANSLVLARPNIYCLGFVDGGIRPRDPIVIGSYQLENNLLEFDLARSRLGFSNSLLLKRTSCATFNFTSTP
ncbi:gamma conglutin 1-like [Apium graveolens]|uniref:gamma conglutin 1-like n=1 Tax=Apium graveolens TaxID=4045 RepID=UPI003D7A6294